MLIVYARAKTSDETLQVPPAAAAVAWTKLRFFLLGNFREPINLRARFE